MLNKGSFLKDIAQHFNASEETIKNLMSEMNLELKTLNRVNRRINSNYFSVIDKPEKAYWLGFLFTDGCVDKLRTTGRIRLQLQERDKEILEKFKEDLQLDCKIIYNIRPNSICCSVEFTDERIFQDLANYNIVPKKTYNINHIPYEKIPSEFRPAFALGLFDGDGSLYCDSNYSTDVSINYTAYHETEVIDFQNLINSLTGIEKKNKNFYTSAWHTQWRGRLQVIHILDILYNNCPRFLKRKHDIYLALKNSLN